LPDWLFDAKFNKFGFFLETLGVKKIVWPLFLAFSFQYLAFFKAVGTYHQTGVLAS